MLKDLLQLKFLKGKRTIIAAIAVAVLTFLKMAEYITVEQYASIVGFLTAAGLLSAANHEK